MNTTPPPTETGPAVEALTHRLADCPREFLDEPRIGHRGAIHVEAVVNDLVLDLGGEPLSPDSLDAFRPSAAAHRNRLRLVLVSAWLLHDPGFRARPGLAPRALRWLERSFATLSQMVDPALFVTDPDRREELARLALAALGLLPAGETPNQAEDRLRTLDSEERIRVIQDTRDKQRKARELREAMRRKEAEEAAAKVSRE